MNTSKIALYAAHGIDRRISGPGTIISMFDHTDDNGILYTPELPRDDHHDNKERFYKCVMNWNFVDLDDALYYYEELYNDLKEIAKKWDVIHSSSAEKVLPKKLLDIWNNYVRDFDTDDKDAICAEAKRRVGNDLAAYDVVIHARRLCRLMSLETPAIIFRNEARLLAQAMVINIYCLSMETVEDVE